MGAKLTPDKILIKAELCAVPGRGWPGRCGCFMLPVREKRVSGELFL